MDMKKGNGGTNLQKYKPGNGVISGVRIYVRLYRTKEKSSSVTRGIVYLL